MSNEQKKLLLQIAELIVKDFDLEMKDRWTCDDHSLSIRYAQKQQELKQQYEAEYGELPQWKNIDDVCETAKQLRKELQE